MRLLESELESIKQAFYNTFQNGKIYLFGSRVDDEKKGGDIDLYIDLNSCMSVKEKMQRKSEFRLALNELIGEQKIDIIISKDKKRGIEQEILKTSILL